MVLPGIQALFGFQLIVVFSPGFSELLPLDGRLLHLAATVLVAAAIALIMAPTAYHRQAEPDRLSRYFAEYASTVITAAMVPLLVALALEVAIISYVIRGSRAIAAVLGSFLLLLYLGLWFIYPRLRRRRAPEHGAD